MSFGGFEHAMITTLKNNDKMRSKREMFKKTYRRTNSNSKPEFNFPDATPKMITEIRKKLKRERKTRMVKIFILTMILCIIIMSLLNYSANGIKEALWY